MYEWYVRVRRDTDNHFVAVYTLRSPIRMFCQLQFVYIPEENPVLGPILGAIETAVRSGNHSVISWTESMRHENASDFVL